jgi:hypothetical protein
VRCAYHCSQYRRSSCLPPIRDQRWVLRFSKKAKLTCATCSHIMTGMGRHFQEAKRESCGPFHWNKEGMWSWPGKAHCFIHTTLTCYIQFL